MWNMNFLVSDDLGCRSGEEDTRRGEKKGEEKVDMKWDLWEDVMTGTSGVEEVRRCSRGEMNEKTQL